MTDIAIGRYRFVRNSVFCQFSVIVPLYMARVFPISANRLGRDPERHCLKIRILNKSDPVSNVIKIYIFPSTLHINSIVNSSSSSVKPMVAICGPDISNYLFSLNTASLFDSFGTSIETLTSSNPTFSDCSTPNVN